MQNFGILFLWALAACTLWNGSLANSLRSGYTILLDDMDPNQSDGIRLPELRSLLNEVAESQNQGNVRDADNEIKSKLETLEVKIGEVQAKQPQEIYAKLEGRLQGVENKLEGRLQGLERQLQEGQTKLEAKLGESLLAVQGKIENQLLAVLNQLKLVQNNIDTVKVGVQALTIQSGFERIGTRYFRIVNESEKWKTAERRCREMGGYLASFRNEEEINAITPKLKKYHLYWLGINDRENEGHFVSVASHKPAQFLKWKEGLPSDRNHKENCVKLYAGEMWDSACNNSEHFICQADNET